MTGDSLATNPIKDPTQHYKGMEKANTQPQLDLSALENFRKFIFLHNCSQLLLLASYIYFINIHESSQVNHIFLIVVTILS